MKKVISCVGAVIVIILFLVLQITVHGKTERRSELNNNLSSAVEQTVDNLLNSKKYKIDNYKEFIADFIENLSYSLDTNSNITVNILNADMHKGLLSVEVIETYKHPNGNMGKEKCTKTVIFDDIQSSESPKSTYTVSFFLSEDDYKNNQNCYKKYEVVSGDKVNTPRLSLPDNKEFICWKDKNGNTADLSQPVVKNEVFYAIINTH